MSGGGGAHAYMYTLLIFSVCMFACVFVPTLHTCNSHSSHCITVMVHSFRKIRELHRITDTVVHRNGQASLTEHSSSSRPHRKKEEDASKKEEDVSKKEEDVSKKEEDVSKKEEDASKKEHVNETESHQHRVNEMTHKQREHDLGSNEAAMNLAEMNVLSNGDAVDPFEFRETVEEGINFGQKDSEQEKQKQTKDTSDEKRVSREQQELEEDGDSFSQSTSNSSSPLLEKSKRVSVHREFDADYQPPAALDINNVSSNSQALYECMLYRRCDN